MNYPLLSEKHKWLLAREGAEPSGPGAFAWYVPLLREIYIDQPPTRPPRSADNFFELLDLIPPESWGYFWHEFTHHLQFISTAQGIRSLFALCDQLSSVDMLLQISRDTGLDVSPPVLAKLSSLDQATVGPDLTPLIAGLRQAAARVNRLFGSASAAQTIPSHLRIDPFESRVSQQIIFSRSSDPMSDGPDSFVVVRTRDKTPAMVAVDSRALREGMAIFVEHATNLNGVLSGDQEAARQYWWALDAESNDDSLLTYYALYLWWRTVVPKQHESFSTFLALCELASMYDAAVNMIQVRTTSSPEPPRRLTHVQYFLSLVEALSANADSVPQINDVDSAPFVEQLLSVLGWPDLKVQAERCLMFVDDFRQRNRGTLFERLVPFEGINAALEFRRARLGNRLLLFELMAPTSTRRALEAWSAVAPPALHFQGIGIAPVKKNKVAAYVVSRAFADVAQKIATRESFHCWYWEADQPQRCHVFRERGCSGNPFPGEPATRYQTCSNGLALLTYFGQRMMNRTWMEPIPTALVDRLKQTRP